MDGTLASQGTKVGGGTLHPDTQNDIPTGLSQFLASPLTPFFTWAPPPPTSSADPSATSNPESQTEMPSSTLPLASHLAWHWKGGGGPGLSLRGRNHSDGPAPTGRQVSAKGLKGVLSKHATLWDRHSAANRLGRMGTRGRRGLIPV